MAATAAVFQVRKVVSSVPLVAAFLIVYAAVKAVANKAVALPVAEVIPDVAP